MEVGQEEETVINAVKSGIEWRTFMLASFRIALPLGQRLEAV
jgi:hypothetical protein